MLRVSSWIQARLEILLEPVNRSLEGALLTSLDLGLALSKANAVSPLSILIINIQAITHQIATDREAVGAAWPVRLRVPRRELAAPEDLVRNLLRLDGPHLVGLARVDKEWRLRDLEVFLDVLGRFDHGRVRRRDDVHVASEREVEAEAAPVAVAQRADLGHAVGLERVQYRADDDVRAREGVLAEPLHEIERRAGVERVDGCRVVVKDVGHNDLEAVAREVIGEELWECD